MIPRLGWTILVAGSLGACKKDDGCSLDGALGPGCGLVMDGEPLRLGDDLADVVASHGEPALVDLGVAGQRFDYAASGVSGFLDLDGAVVSLMVTAPYDGVTADGLGLGSGAAQVETTMGSALEDAYTGALHDPGQGLSVELADGTVERVHIWAPQLDW
jgi:hypothetical protein